MYENDSLFMEERHQKILELLELNGKISVSLIQRKFAVGYGTAQRDLRLLEEQGKLIRTHGGALPIKFAGEGKPAGCTGRDISEIKENYLAAARYAASTIRAGEVIYITSASVGYLMVKNLPRGIHYTVVVNSAVLADELRQYPELKIILCGGELDDKSNAYDGFACEMLSRLRIDRAFITAGGITASFGLSIQSSKGVSFMNALLASSREAVGLFPTEKVGFEYALRLCPASALSELITDWECSQEKLNEFEELGIKTTIVERPGDNAVQDSSPTVSCS